MMLWDRSVRKSTLRRRFRLPAYIRLFCHEILVSISQSKTKETRWGQILVSYNMNQSSWDSHESAMLYSISILLKHIFFWANTISSCPKNTKEPLDRVLLLKRKCYANFSLIILKTFASLTESLLKSLWFK